MKALPTSTWSTRREARPWLFVGFALIVTIDVVIWRAEISLPGVPELRGEMLLRLALLGAVTVSLLLTRRLVARDLGLSLIEPRVVATWALVPIAVLGILAILFIAGSIVVARFTPLNVAVRPGTLQDLSEFWTVFVGAVILGPVYEECVFRGLLTSALDCPGRRWLTVTLSSVLFSILHLAYGHPAKGLASWFVLGVLSAIPFMKARSVIAPIALHAVFNAVVLVKDAIVLRYPGFVRWCLGYDS